MQKLSIAEVLSLAASFVDVQSRGGTGEFYSNQVMGQTSDIVKAFWSAVEALER